jgi:hypothetical protein
VITVIMMYLAAVGVLYVAQDKLLFPRTLTHRGHLPLPSGSERVELVSSEGHRLVGYALRRPQAKDIVLLFTGNAWNAEDCFIYSAERFRGAHLMAFHYRGYTPSEGTPSEAALLEDAVAQRDLARRLFNHPAEQGRIYAVGYSIGTGVAARLAGDGAVDGAVLVTPFDSVEAVAKSRYFFAPVSVLLKNKFRSDRALSGKDVPVAVIMAALDRVIPKARSDALVAQLGRPVLVETVQGAGHVSLYDLPLFDELLAVALVKVMESRPPGVPRHVPGRAGMLLEEGVAGSG